MSVAKLLANMVAESLADRPREGQSILLQQASNLVLDEETTVGNYFVSNYPPYSFWSEANVGDALAAENAPAPRPGRWPVWCAFRGEA